MKDSNPSGVFRGVHDVRVESMDVPVPGDDSVIIKVEMTGICGTDLHIYHEGLVPEGSVLGHEFSGELINVGKNVIDMNVGDRVVVNPMINGTGLGLSPGGFARYVKIDNAKLNSNLFIIPDKITSEKGALVEPLSVGLAAINHTNLNKDDNILVSGCGTIGLVTIAGLKAKGYENIIASDISEKRLELAKKLGAKMTYNPKSDGDLGDVISEKFGMVDSLNYAGQLPNLNAAFECTGVSAIFKQITEVLAPDAKLTVLAIYRKPTEFDPNNVVYKRLNIKGSLFYSADDFLEAIKLMETGKLDISPIVSHHFPLSKLPEAFEVQADSSQSVKVMVDSE
ncbi:zinc-dependent alcohol dehydrogenase [Marinigracilibium pacificum]|uniref:Zinc-binding dehydrogenase n=1 Tax=Marinigracilibium pacificum TaxID=2729599 RepID=A0A848IX37_9BACT|nr:zinc-binding dehydrogenase [Marinigracilibium pacificum]NMM47845.1 zinc-binding dehydrogenase [Marinigracilibium pacificum]